METCEGLNPDLSVEMEDNSIGKESQLSRPDYNRLETLHLTTDTLTPVVDMILWSTMTQPRGHLSCKKLKN
jgi:hypothetical protein